MNYSFYLLKIAQLSNSTLTAVKEYADSLTLDPSTSYFVPGYHPGMISGSYPIMKPNSIVPDSVSDVLDEINFVLPRNTALSYMVNRLSPNGFIKEHTDATGGPQSTGYNISHQHLVHFNLSGRSKYGFRRSQETKFTWFTMEEGGVYLYNNYVWHVVKNDFEENLPERTNLIIYYNDPIWETKNKIYKAFNCQLGGY